ncbi:hypothetical protein EV424DRAFT_1594851 [Suillus variegatus]|nr:hypothetical protein EV424DRAFT_1594851 [Suillus variegatus]
MPKPAFCKGNPDESVPCYCEEYSAPTNIPVGQKELCAECLHGKSKHPRPQPPVLPVAELPAVTTAKERAGVTAIFKQSLARRAGQGSQNTTTVTAARDEVMAGFRPTAKQKFPGRIVSSRQASSSKQGHVPIKVGAIAVLVNYLDDKGELLTTIPPVKTEMSKFKRRGCAHFDGDQSEDGGSVDFSFCLDWTFEEVDAYIRRLFPKVFEYLDSVNVGDVKGKATDNGASEWVLISKENRRLSVAPEPFPTGKHLERYKGRSNAPLQQTNIFIGIRKFIPEHTYACWDPDMVIIDIADDSDDGDDGDDNDHKQEYGPGLKIEDDVFTQVPKIVRPKRPMQRGTRQEPAQKKMRGTHGRPIASKMGNKSGRSSGKVKLFCSSDSDTDNSLNALPASLKGMSISPLTQKRAPRHNPMMPLIKDEEHQDIDLQDFAKAQTHVSAMPLPNRPLFQPLVSVQPTLNDLLRGHPDFISHILAFIVASDGIVNENLIEFFANLLLAVSVSWLKKCGLTFSSATKRTTPPPTTNPFPPPPAALAPTPTYGHHYPSPPKPAFPPPNSSYITPPTLPDTPSPGYSTSTSTASTASPPTPPASSSPGIPKHEPVPVPPPLKHKMFAFASPLDLPSAR